MPATVSSFCRAFLAGFTVHFSPQAQVLRPSVFLFFFSKEVLIVSCRWKCTWNCVQEGSRASFPMSVHRTGHMKQGALCPRSDEQGDQRLGQYLLLPCLRRSAKWLATYRCRQLSDRARSFGTDLTLLKGAMKNKSVVIPLLTGVPPSLSFIKTKLHISRK